VGRPPLRIEPLEERRLLAIVVDTLVDENDGIAVGGISLRDAIAAAPTGETIEFSPALTDGGPATILLTRGELRIASNLTIIGPGATLLTIDASGNDPNPDVNSGNGSRVFHITDNVDSLKSVTIRNLTLTGGDTSGPGGAILARENLTLAGCVVTGNATFTATQLGGGGIYSATNSFTPNSLTLVDCTITNNSAVRDEGGGIRKRYGSLSMERCLVDGNTASTYGAGLSGADGGAQIEIRSTTFSDNTTTQFSGGGIFTYSAFLTLVESTVSGNTAGWGAGVYLRAASQGTVERSAIINNVARVDGGGINLNESQLTLTGSTLSGNSARGYGGGAAVPNGTLVIRHSTVTANHANTDNTGSEQGGGVILGTTSTLTLDHSIVARNFRATSFRSDAIGPVAARFSLIGDSSGAALFNNGGNLLGDAGAPIDPRLGPLAPNGGPTMSHALLPNSPAIGAGDPAAMAGGASVPASDQRGATWSRIVGGRIDIGAFERQPNPLSGDYNFNGIVDAADYVVWRKTLNSAVDLRADGDGDGKVDQDDRAVWQANFGSTIEAQSASVEADEEGALLLATGAARRSPSRPRLSIASLQSAERPTYQSRPSATSRSVYRIANARPNTDYDSAILACRSSRAAYDSVSESPIGAIPGGTSIQEISRRRGIRENHDAIVLGDSQKAIADLSADSHLDAIDHAFDLLATGRGG
jgi:hypothetical protein